MSQYPDNHGPGGMDIPIWAQPESADMYSQQCSPLFNDRSMPSDQAAEDIRPQVSPHGMQSAAQSPSVSDDFSQGISGAVVLGEIQKAVGQLTQMTEELKQKVNLISQDNVTGFSQTDDKIQLLEQKVGELIGKSTESMVGCSAEQRQRYDTLKKAVETLTARNTDVLRQTMDFTNNSARRWTKELDGYRSLFKDSVYDDLWKRLADIYLGVQKHLKRKNNPELFDDVSFCVLEPLQDLMEEYGITMQVTPTGEKRSFRRTKAKGIVPTNDPAKDATVASTISPGFMRGNIILIPEVVETYVYQEGYEAPATTENTSATETSDQIIEADLYQLGIEAITKAPEASHREEKSYEKEETDAAQTDSLAEAGDTGCQREDEGGENAALESDIGSVGEDTEEVPASGIENDLKEEQENV